MVHYPKVSKYTNAGSAIVQKGLFIDSASLLRVGEPKNKPFFQVLSWSLAFLLAPEVEMETMEDRGGQHAQNDHL